MTNTFRLPIDEISRDWKNLRNSLPDHSDEENLQRVVDFWSLAPLSKMAYDPEALDTYPSPWEMIQNNDWCRNSIAVAMEFTLRLGGYDASRLKIKMIRDYDICDQMLVVVVDDKYFLNYEYLTVSPIPSTKYDVLEVWQHNGRKYTKCST